jgi:hypothetical protein
MFSFNALVEEILYKHKYCTEMKIAYLFTKICGLEKKYEKNILGLAFAEYPRSKVPRTSTRQKGRKPAE